MYIHITVEIKQIGKHVSVAMYTHTYSTRTVGNGDLCMVRVGAIKRIGKHVSAATYMHVTVEELQESVTSVRFVQGQ
jgi:hypothetical protein